MEEGMAWDMKGVDKFSQVLQRDVENCWWYLLVSLPGRRHRDVKWLSCWQLLSRPFGPDINRELWWDLRGMCNIRNYWGGSVQQGVHWTLIKVRKPDKMLSSDASRMIHHQAWKGHSLFQWPREPEKNTRINVWDNDSFSPHRLDTTGTHLSHPSTISFHLGEEQGEGKGIYRENKFYLNKMGSWEDTILSIGSDQI